MAYVLANIGAQGLQSGESAIAVNSTSRAVLIDVGTATIAFPSSVTVISGGLSLLASTESIGHVVADASTASIGSLAASTESIGHVVLDASTASIGKLAASTESIGLVVLAASTASVGKLSASTESIGLVVLAASTASIGKLAASTESIGNVGLLASTASIGKLAGSTEAIGHVVLDAGTALIGKVNPGMTLLALSAGIPTTTSAATTATIGVAIPAGTLRLTLAASASGITVNYNAAATTGGFPVPTYPLPMDCNATDAALLQFLGDNSATVSIVFQG